MAVESVALFPCPLRDGRRLLCPGKEIEARIITLLPKQTNAFKSSLDLGAGGEEQTL